MSESAKRQLLFCMALLAATAGSADAAGDEFHLQNEGFPDSRIELKAGLNDPSIELRSRVGDSLVLSTFSPSIEMKEGDLESTLRFADFFEFDRLLEVWVFKPLTGLALSPEFVGQEVILYSREGLMIASNNPSQRYLVDGDENDAVANHIWYENSTSTSGPDWRMMQLTEEMGGTLYVDGPVNQNHSFDIAETFWEAAPVAPGELVAIDPERPTAVRPTSAAAQATLLGVASTRPGFVLGGGAFSLEAFRRTWGDAIADEYQRRRPELEERMFAEIPQLRERDDRLRSQASYEAYLALVAPAEIEEGPTADQIGAAYETLRGDHETVMFDRTLQRYLEDRFTRVALAGRVPVKADASFGAIRPGDYLTSSPIAGVAMRASGPGPILGTALEPLSAGAGLIQVFVHRGWYGGQGASLATPAAAPARPDARDLRIAELERRLAALEGRLEGLPPGPAALARAGLSPADRSNAR